MCITINIKVSLQTFIFIFTIYVGFCMHDNYDDSKINLLLQ